MIEARDLQRRFGDLTAVRGISFSVADGEILGILGPNGAGKTTTIRMITGFLPPTGGQVTVNGHNLFREPSRVRREIGYLPEQMALYPEMRVQEYLAYRAQLFGMSRKATRTALGKVLERCLLTTVQRQILGTLSKGYRQRVGLAAAILHGPRVLVLDEPTVGLDPKQIIAIRELIRELGRDRTLLLSTHILPEVEQLCQRVLIIDRGHLVADGTPSELRQRALGRSRLRIRLEDPAEGAGERLTQIPGVEELHPEPPTGGGNTPVEVLFTLVCRPGADLRKAVFQTAVEQGWVLLEMREQTASLEDVFVRLTRRAASDEPEDATSEPSTSEHAASEDPASGDTDDTQETPS